MAAFTIGVSVVAIGGIAVPDVEIAQIGVDFGISLAVCNLHIVPAVE